MNLCSTRGRWLEGLLKKASLYRKTDGLIRHLQEVPDQPLYFHTGNKEIEMGPLCRPIPGSQEETTTKL